MDTIRAFFPKSEHFFFFKIHSYSPYLNYKISIRQVSNSVILFDQVVNDIITWFVDEDFDQEEVEDDSDDSYGELDKDSENNSDPTEERILEDEVIEAIDDGKSIFALTTQNNDLNSGGLIILLQ